MNINPSWKKLKDWSLKKQKKLQSKKLQHMLRLLDMAPFYHSLFKVSKVNINIINSIDDLSKIPFTEKEDVVDSIDHSEKFSSFVINPIKKLHKLPKLTTTKLFFSGNLKKQLLYEFKPIHIHFTTGRSAMSIPVLYTQHDLKKLTESAHRVMSLIKLPFTARVVNVFPFAPHLAFWQTVYATNYLGIFGLHTGGGKIMGTERIIDSIESMEAEAIMGMPSYVFHLVHHAIEEEKSFPNLKYIIIGGEAVTPDYIHKLKELLSKCNANNVNILTTYAFTEGKVAWSQCHEDSGYHLYPDMEYIEIVDESGNRVADGDSGEIVYTGLDFRGTAFLRYKTGDYGSLEVGPCKFCGAKTPRLSNIITRSSEIRPMKLTKVKGTLIDFNAVTALLTSLNYLSEWQLIIQKKNKFDLDEVILYVSLRSGENIRRVKKELEREMKANFNITPIIKEKTRRELVEMLCLESELKEKRIVDKR